MTIKPLPCNQSPIPLLALSNQSPIPLLALSNQSPISLLALSGHDYEPLVGYAHVHLLATRLRSHTLCCVYLFMPLYPFLTTKQCPTPLSEYQTMPLYPLLALPDHALMPFAGTTRPQTCAPCYVYDHISELYFC